MSDKDCAHADNFNHLSTPSTMTYSSTGAARDNKGKPKLSSVPFVVLEAIAGVLYRNSEEGGGKYPTDNWRKGAPHSVPLDSLIRHAFRLADGERIDPDDGLPHSWKILCNAAFLVFYQKYYPSMDDLRIAPGTKEEPKIEAPTESTPVNLGALLPMLAMAMAAKGKKQDESKAE